jgi:hypothetical protein
MALTRSRGFHTLRTMTNSLSLGQIKWVVHLNDQIAPLEGKMTALFEGVASAQNHAFGTARSRKNEARPSSRNEISDQDMNRGCPKDSMGEILTGGN